MMQNKFQGVDLDWEFPGQAVNGGNSNDKANLVSLLSEMRTSFGTDFGISLTLPTDAGYLGNYNLPALQSSVDWFGLMVCLHVVFTKLFIADKSPVIRSVLLQQHHRLRRRSH